MEACYLDNRSWKFQTRKSSGFNCISGKSAVPFTSRADYVTVRLLLKPKKLNKLNCVGTRTCSNFVTLKILGPNLPFLRNHHGFFLQNGCFRHHIACNALRRVLFFRPRFFLNWTVDRCKCSRANAAVTCYFTLAAVNSVENLFVLGQVLVFHLVNYQVSCGRCQ